MRKIGVKYKCRSDKNKIRIKNEGNVEMKYIVVYGIAYVEEKENRRETVIEIPGLTSEENEINRLVDLCNRNSLSPCQLRDVVEDMLEAR